LAVSASFTWDGSSLYVGGAISSTGDITAFYSPSDRRLKENIVKLDGALEKVNQINGYSYNYINNTTKLVGVIAQELETVLPEAVYNFTPENITPDTTEPYKAVRYELVIPLLIEAIKELKAEVELLKNK